MGFKANRTQTEGTSDGARYVSNESYLPWRSNAHNAPIVPMTHTTQPEFSSSSFIIPTPEVAERIRQQPECRLLWAILQDGIETYVKYSNASNKHTKRLFVEAEEWIMQEDFTWLCSFVNICHVLAIEPDYIRTGLKRWRLRTQPLDSRAAA